MVVKVYVSGISASKEVKKRQQRALCILESVPVDYEQVDITEPGREEERQQVQSKFKVRGENNPLPPQFFSDDDYLGDYEDFNSAVDVNNLLTFLRLENDTNIKAQENNNKQETVEEAIIQNEKEAPEVAHISEEMNEDVENETSVKNENGENEVTNEELVEIEREEIVEELVKNNETSEEEQEEEEEEED